MVDTMLRSGVPPHIGQSPVPGSDAARRAGANESDRQAATASRAAARYGLTEMHAHERLMCH